MQVDDYAKLLEPEVYPDTALLVTEDGKPVDNLFVEKQYRLLTEPLWTSWKNPDGRPFRALANVGLFFAYRQPPLVPDAMFAIDVESPRDARESDFRSYFVWVVGKPPDIAIEIVSDKRGREDSEKLAAYQRIKVPFYVIFDPDQRIGGDVLRAFGLHHDKYVPMDPVRFGDIGLGLTLWDGEVEGASDTWLRWIDALGNVVPNAEERTKFEMERAKLAEANAETEKSRAEAEKSRAEAEKSRAEAEKSRADAEKTRADAEQASAHAEKARADAAEARARRLEEKLRAAGISTNGAQ